MRASRDGVRPPNNCATGKRRRVKRKDVLRAIQGRVTATNAGGSATAESVLVVPKRKHKRKRK